MERNIFESIHKQPIYLTQNNTTQLFHGRAELHWNFSSISKDG